MILYNNTLSPTNIETEAEIVIVENENKFFSPILILYGITTEDKPNLTSFYLGNDFKTWEETLKYGLDVINMMNIKYAYNEEMEMDEYIILRYDHSTKSNIFETVKYEYKIDDKLINKSICGKNIKLGNILDQHKTIQ